MKPLIPKEPCVPKLTQEEIAFLTDLTFGIPRPVKRCDALFIFSGTHSGHWEKAIEAFEKGYAERIIVTGGRSSTGVPHPDWEGNEMKDCTEADIIISYLEQAGIPASLITYEDQSTNSLENVLFSKDVFDFSSIKTLMVICKGHVAGRQIRTLQQHLPRHIEYIPFTFPTSYRGVEINRRNWMETETGRSRVWGEYLRIDKYGKKGHILPMDE